MIPKQIYGFSPSWPFVYVEIRDRHPKSRVPRLARGMIASGTLSGYNIWCHLKLMIRFVPLKKKQLPNDIALKRSADFINSRTSVIEAFTCLKTVTFPLLLAVGSTCTSESIFSQLKVVLVSLWSGIKHSLPEAASDKIQTSC